MKQINHVAQSLPDSYVSDPISLLCTTYSTPWLPLQEQYIFIHDALMEHIASGNTEVRDSQVAAYVEELQAGAEHSLMNKQFKVSRVLISLHLNTVLLSEPWFSQDLESWKRQGISIGTLMISSIRDLLSWYDI